MKRYIGTSLLLAFFVLLYGCSAAQTKLYSDLQAEFDKPLYCEGEDECKLMWERATFFVNSNAAYKIQIHNDTVIQTYNPSENSPSLAFSVTKEPLGNGKYQIWTKAWCANMFGCQPNHIETIAKAKKYIRTGQK